MIWWRFLRVTAHLVEGLLIAALVFPWLSVARREAVVKWWSVHLLGICRMRVRFIGDSHMEAHALIVSNHISWLDIFVINSWQPCRFVAKSDIRSWPFIGWLCERAGTIFLARGKQRDVRRIYEGLVHELHDGERVAFFPEGTTARQGELLPFHGNLFEAAIKAQVPVQPFAVRYLDAQGRYHPAADFVGDMTFVESLAVILGSGRIDVELIKLPQISTLGAHRRETAQQAREVIAEALGLEMAETEAEALVA